MIPIVEFFFSLYSNIPRDRTGPFPYEMLLEVFRENHQTVGAFIYSRLSY